MRYQNVELHNVQDIQERKDVPGIWMSRLPLDLMPQVNEGVQRGSFSTTGCEIRCDIPVGKSLKVEMAVDNDDIIPPLVEVYHGCIRRSTTLLGREPVEIVIERPPLDQGLSAAHTQGQLPFDPAVTRIVLPHLHSCRLVSMSGDVSPPSADQTPESTLLSYGSSITHGAHAIPPSGTYAAQTSRHLGVDLINLGFGGSAQMDAGLAEHIAARTDWDLATLEMGINVGGWETDRFRKTVETFIRTIATAHPEKWIFCIDIFTFFNDFHSGYETHKGFREAVRDAVRSVNMPRVVHIDGRDILKSPAGLRLDLVHPSDDGMREMGHRLAGTIESCMQKREAKPNRPAS